MPSGYPSHDQDPDEEGEIKSIFHPSSFITQILFKAIVIGMFYLKGLLIGLTSNLIYMELLFIFIVVDFWMTKNVNGRQMLGVRWYFGDDEYGVERFKFETRINEDYVSTTTSKLFWLLQLGYVVIPIIHLVTIIIISPNLQRIVLPDVLFPLSPGAYQCSHVGGRRLQFLLLLEGFVSGGRAQDGAEEEIRFGLLTEDGPEFNCVLSLIYGLVCASIFNSVKYHYH